LIYREVLHFCYRQCNGIRHRRRDGGDPQVQRSLEGRGPLDFRGGPQLAVIDNRAEAAIVTDGPFVETKEWVSGFWIIDAPDRDTAVALATEGSKACNRRVEVRSFLGD